MLSAFFLAAAAAAPASGSQEPSCLDRDSTNYEFALCTKSIIDASDLALNAAWNRLFHFEGGSQSARGRALLAEQRAWLVFRSKACAEYETPDSGREEQVIHGPLCIANIIDARTKDLNDRYESMNH